MGENRVFVSKAVLSTFVKKSFWDELNQVVLGCKTMFLCVYQWSKCLGRVWQKRD